MATQATISPDIIKWARNRSHLTPERLAKSAQIKAGRAREWENGNSQPTYRQARQLAKVLHIPLAYLYLSSPPSESLPIPDLRALPGRNKTDPSTDFLAVLNAARRKQDWYREYLQAVSAEELSFVGSFTPSDDPRDMARSMRDALSVDETIQSTSTSWSEFMTRLVRAAEVARVLVFRSGIVGNNTHRPLDVDEFRGFALSDPIAPAVFINVRDAKTAQIFTLAHELAHLWLGESGVSDLAGETESTEIGNDVERFCDRAATEFLVPEGSFQDRWPQSLLGLAQVTQELAKTYRVSTTVILRRALELGRVSRQDFFRQLEIERSRQTSPVRSESGGSFRNSFVARNSAPLIAAVFESVLEGKALHREAATVLDLKTSTLSRLADEYKLAR